MKVEYKKSYHGYIHTAMGKAISDEVGFVKFMIDAKSNEYSVVKYWGPKLQFLFMK